MADDKVVIGSTGGTPVKPGDLTRITSVGKVDLNDPDATATIPRITPRVNTKSDSVETSTINREEIRAKLEEDKPKKATIKLKPVVAREGGEGGETATVPLQAGAPRIITATSPAPAPAPAQATAVPKFASGPEPEEDETVKIQKPRAVNASTALPGVKQTIKLRPSSTTPAPMSGSESNVAIIPPAPPPAAAPQPQAPPLPVAGGSEAKRTIRLVPKKSDATSGGDPVVASARPSAPTVKLEEPPPPPAPAEPARSAVTVKLPSAETGADAAAPKRTLKLKSSRAPEPSTPAAPPAPVATIPNSPAIASATDAEMPAIAREDREIPLEMAQKESSSAGKQEPSMIFTIAACVAFFVMAYFTWMLVGQYCNNYMDSKISVPGLSGKVK